jgi:hypothetical protein
MKLGGGKIVPTAYIKEVTMSAQLRKVAAVKDQLPRHSQLKEVQAEVNKWVSKVYDDRRWLYYDAWFNSEKVDSVRSLRFRVHPSHIHELQGFADELVAKVKQVLAKHNISEVAWYVYTFNPVGDVGSLVNNNIKIFYQSS